MLQGVKVLQQKLAEVIGELTGGGGDRGMGGMDGVTYGGPRSPDMNGGAGTAYGGMDQGYTTPYAGAGGSTSVWGGAATPFGAQPYGGGY